MTVTKILILLVSLGFVLHVSGKYSIGTGIADITGPAAEINMMGMANPKQMTGGIHIRLYSRAYVIAHGASRVVFVSTDMAMIPQIVKTKVAQQIKALYNGIYDEKNIMLSSTHTHSGPGGYHQYLLFAVTSRGFVKESFQASVDGIVQSIKMAHENLRPGRILMASGDLIGSNINRSPTSYLRNPAEERAKYKADIDTEMTLIKFVSDKKEELGLVNWFPVHGTSMNNTNILISGDNKGYASQLFERLKNPNHLMGQGPFVAAFGQANEGDVSPNTYGPHCQDTGKSCDQFHSTCNGKVEQCISSGPGKDMFESTKIIGYNQFKKALELYDNATEELSGPVGYVHQFVDMSNQTVKLDSGAIGRTCLPAMGYSFAAGTTDGPGAFNFFQGETSGSPIWDAVRNLLKRPTKEQIECQKPKPILLDTGAMTFPYLWQPNIVETQMIRIGQLVIVAVPGEFTTMSGRRLKIAVQKAMSSLGNTANLKVVIAGLSNTYSDYITTYEEYQAQRYESASTIYGPHTLSGYLQQYSHLATALAKNISVPPGPPAPYFVDKLWSFVTPVITDNAGRRSYGAVKVQPKAVYKAGDTVEAIFQSAHPRNNMRLNGTFMTVDRYINATGAWQVVYTDAYWETKFHWYRKTILDSILGRSDAQLSWTISSSDLPGTYRIRHFGTSKNLLKTLTNFEGATRPFQVIAQKPHFTHQRPFGAM